MKMTYSIPLVFVLEVESENTELPVEAPKGLVISLLSELNISGEVNDRFLDDLQEQVDGDILSYKFKKVKK